MALYGTRYAYYYTSREEIQRLLSDDGEELHSDDFYDNSELMQEIIERATGRVRQYMRKSYDDSDLANSPRIREITTIIACYLLSIRRGNPSLYQEQYVEAMADMQAIVDNILYLDELPRSSNAPAFMQNVSSDNRTPFTPMRVDMITSTRTTGKEWVGRFAPFSWL